MLNQSVSPLVGLPLYESLVTWWWYSGINCCHFTHGQVQALEQDSEWCLISCQRSTGLWLESVVRLWLKSAVLCECNETCTMMNCYRGEWNIESVGGPVRGVVTEGGDWYPVISSWLSWRTHRQSVDHISRCRAGCRHSAGAQQRTTLRPHWSQRLWWVLC